MSIPELLTVAKVITNYDDAITLVNNTLKTEDITVPTGKRWWLQVGYMTNGDDVSRVCSVEVFDGTNLIFYVKYSAALGAAGTAVFPNTTASLSNVLYPKNGLPIEAGWIIRFTWQAGGASSGGTSTISALVLEVDV